MNEICIEPLTEKSNILIVDDREENLFILVSLLKPLECTITKASSGKQALEKYEPDKYACLLLDVQMPILSGFDVANQIQKKYNSLPPILFISAAYQENTSILEGYDSGASLTFLTLLKKIKALLTLEIGYAQ